MIRLGVVGYGRRAAGWISGSLRPVAAAAGEEIRVVGVVDPDEAGARGRLAPEDAKTGFFDTLPVMVGGTRPDALLIAPRCDLHAGYAVQAAALDLPVFLEKPVAISQEQAAALETAFSAPRCRTLVSFPLRVSPLCELARHHLRDGAVGQPQHILATNYVPYGTIYWERFYRDTSITGGLFLQKATHDFDAMMALMDSPITRVAATAHHGGVFGGDRPEGLRCSECDERRTCLESPQNRARNRSGGSTADHLCVFSRACGTPETGTNEDTSSALLEFASGAHGLYTQVFFSRRDAAARGAVISGYHGTLDFDWYRNDLRLVRHHEPFTTRATAAEGMSHFGGDEELARNFLGMILHGEESRADIRAGLRSVYACLAARESARTGTFVDVGPPAGP